MYLAGSRDAEGLYLASDSDKAAEALKNHSALIARIKEAWPEAAAGLREYSAESKTILTQDTKDAINLYKKQIVETSNAVAYSLSGVTRRSRASGDPIVEQLTQATKQLMDGVRAGDPPLRQFVERLIEIQNQKGAPSNLKEIIEKARETAKGEAGLRQVVDNARGSLRAPSPPS